MYNKNLFLSLTVYLAEINMAIFHRYWNWCKRFPYRCGYGVHSPTDFFLITSVIYEQGAYYAYQTLGKKHFSVFLPHYRKKVNRLLFRLVNHLRPHSLIEVGIGNGASISYMRAARTSMKSFTIKGKDLDKTLFALNKDIQTLGGIDLLHIGYTPYYQEVFERALPFVSDASCFIIGNIYQTKEKKMWWKRLQEDERVKLTFDLYDIGLVFFDRKRIKQNYIVNFL